MLFSNNGERFVYTSTKRKGADHDIYMASMNKPESAKAFLAKGGAWYAMDWSPDDTKLLALRYVSAEESHLYIIDIHTKKVREIAEGQEPGFIGHAFWSANGQSVFLTTDRGSEYLTLARYSIADNAFRPVFPLQRWNVEEMAMTPKRDLIACTLNEGGIDNLYFIDPQTFKITVAKNIPQGQINNLAFAPNSARLGFFLDLPDRPKDVYAYDIGDAKLTRWTTSEMGALSGKKLSRHRLIHYPTFDSIDGAARTIPAFVFAPEGRGPFPTLVKIHGGPESQATPTFSPEIQYLVRELGIAVMLSNVRGSRGYGKTYLGLDNGFKREDAVKDIGALIDWITAQKEFDGTRIAVPGLF